MTVESTLVTLRQYRFESVLVAVVALGAALMGVVITLRLNALGVSQDCLKAVNASEDGFSAGEECFNLVRAGSEILGTTYLKGDGTLRLSVMGLLPFVMGVFGGIPIVARELEDRTAQLAWSLNSSRRRWLGRQMAPVAGVVLISAAIAASAAAPVAEGWDRWYPGEASELIGLHGPLVVVRAFGAFGIAIAAGAVCGRTFPAFVLSLAALFAVGMLESQARDRWLLQLPHEVLATYSADYGGWIVTSGGHPLSIGWMSPDGVLLTRDEAQSKAIAAGVPSPPPGELVDPKIAVWLADHGYAEVPIGVTERAALRWAPFDGAIYGVVGALGMSIAIAVVSRKRPS